MNAQAMTHHDLEAKIVQRSWEDNVRRKFVAYPDGAFGKYFQIPTDRLPQIVAHEETAGTWHIVLPARLANASELSDTDLERVAGGTASAAAPAAAATAAAAGGIGTTALAVGSAIWAASYAVTISGAQAIVHGGW
jgi:hypothetical protein